MNKTYIDIKNVHKSFQKNEVFGSIQLSLNKGEILSLVGPSGTGKSTFLRCLAGLDQFSSGDVLIEGKTILSKKTKDRPIGMVFQQPLLFPHLTILENVTYGLRLHKKKKEADIVGMKYMKFVGLEGYTQMYPHSLSGGQQQRVALIRALIVKPKLLLLDEPFSSLDPDLRRELRDGVRQLLKKEGMTAIFVTHDREEAMLLGDRVAVLANGSLQQIGNPQDVYEHPYNQTVAHFFSDALVVDEHHYIRNYDLNWTDSKVGHSTENIFYRAEWLNESYHYGKRYAHVKMIEKNRRLVLPIDLDFRRVAHGEMGYIRARQSTKCRFNKEGKFNE
ncbi:ABC transporter ATP-binding protein [Jeotgalibacillus marinus]|uniref:ABC transporter ATP-binding protein n=1 Tax=Jeotgalibacillus marinus TaxID=86667 RepID=A0ABV3Q6T0_9BACL